MMFQDPIQNSSDNEENAGFADPAGSAGQVSSDDNSNPQSADDSKFDIPGVVREKYPDILELILVTKSMDDKERQYWFHILPVMNEQQVEKLRGILENERQKLAEIEEKYSLANQPEKETKEIDEGAIQQKIEKVQEAERAHLDQEAEKEAELLAQLEEL